MTFSDTTSLAKARISPFFWSIATRNSRAGPTAFFAADNKRLVYSPDQDIPVDALLAFPELQYG